MIIKRNKIPTILGIILLVIGTFAGVFFLNTRQVFRIGADVSVIPKDVRITNINDTTTTVSWITDKETSAFINWGGSPGNTNQVTVENESNQKFFTHMVTLTGLEASTEYFFKINSEGTTFDNNGVPWQFTTGRVLPINQNSIPISGSVINASGTPVERALIYITVGGYVASTLTSDAGNFIFQLGSIRTPDLQNYAQIDEAQTLLEISIQGGPLGVSTAQIFPQSAKPVPTIILGRVYDFRNLEPGSDGQNPNALLRLPEAGDLVSKFNLPSDLGTPAPLTSIILESLSQGEIVTSSKPAFFGKGPGGSEITVSLTADTLLSETFQISQDGSWEWNTPQDLTPGQHTITISWKDSSGITRSLTRDFIVQAGEIPAFEATPSQTLVPTPSPASLPTISPTVIPTPSAPPVPVTGNLTPTLLISIMGIGVITFSFFLWKMAEN